MLAGFVDGRGRASDIGFRTLRFSLTDSEGFLAMMAGEEVRAQGGAIASMDLIEAKPLPLLKPVRGDLISTPRRVVFLAAAGLQRAEPFTFFNVSFGLQKTAGEHFFTVQGGREFVQFEKGDIESSSRAGPSLELVLRGARPGAPKEMARYRLRIEPESVAREAVDGLG